MASMSGEFGDEFTGSQFMFPLPPDDPLWSRVRNFFRRQIAVIRLAEFGVALAFAIGAWFAGGEMFLVIPALVLAWGAAFIGLLASNLRGRYVALWATIIAGGLVTEGSILYWHFHEADARTLLAQWTGKFQPAKPPPVSAPQPFERPSPLVSRANKFIFACDVPVDPHVTPEQQAHGRAELERGVKAWGAMLGFTATVSDVEGGIQITVEANTIEGKNRFLSAGVSPLATKLVLEMRRIGPRIMVTAYPDLPKEFSIFSLFPADPSSPQIAPAEKQVSKMFGWPEGTCHVV